MMKVIYVMENKINGKKYVGQTNNFQKRMNRHKSDSNNPNSHSYNYPLACAIRKYGWNNFKNYIIEELSDDEDWSYVDEREKYFIFYYQSLITQNGYNITTGGQGCPKSEKMSYEEKITKSKVFSANEIKDIQRMLKEQVSYPDILEKYYPKLKDSFLSNINTGLNFKNDNWDYPLNKHLKKEYGRSWTEIHLIKQDIIDGVLYKEICDKWNISIGMVANINNGRCWAEDCYSYPLSIRANSRLHNANTWVKEVQKDLMDSNLTIKEIAKKYQKSHSTIEKINIGNSHKKNKYKYPLTSNRT